MAANINSNRVLIRRHPKYAEYNLSWQFFLESYLGGPSYINKHLFRYFKEGEEEFAKRKERGYRENHTKRVIDMVNSYLFKESAFRQTENALIKKFFDNFDGRGRPIDRFMKLASIFSSIMGRVYIVCDKPPLPDELITGTQGDNLRPEAFPYCYMVYPQNVLDISFDELGQIRWALVLEQKRDDEDPFNSSGDVEDRYRLWLPDHFYLYDDKGALIEEGDTKLGRVPIVILDSEEQDEYTGQSLVADVAYLDRAIMNNWSRLDVIVNDQTFSQLIFPVEGLPADILEDKKLREKFLTLAGNRVILYSAQAQAAPQFISPDASQSTFVLDMISKQVKQLYASLGLQGETATEIKENSGVAKAYDFDKLNKLLASKADNIEQAEREIVEIFKLFMGGIKAEVVIDYPDEFNVKSLADEVALVQELTLLDISKTFTKQLHKALVGRTLPRLNQKTAATIEKEIDEQAKDDEEAAKLPRFPFDQNKPFTQQQGIPGQNPQQPGESN